MKFVPNPAGIEALAATAAMEEAMREKAENVLKVAQGIAPVETGAYRDSLHVESGIDGGKAHATVGDDVRYGAYVEFGTSDTPAHATLRRALESGGSL